MRFYGAWLESSDLAYCRLKASLITIIVQEDADKSRFFSSLSSQLDACPDVVARSKILPQLIIAFEFGNAGSSILTPVFKIGKTLDSKVGTL
jgi:SCY1-like protein 1